MLSSSCLVPLPLSLSLCGARREDWPVLVNGKIKHQLARKIIRQSCDLSHLPTLLLIDLWRIYHALETKLKRTFPFLFPPFSYLLNFSLDRSTRDHRFDSIICCINRRNEASKVFEIESLFSLEARNKMLRVLLLNTWVVESVSFPTTRFVELYFREWEKVGCFDDYCVWKNRIEKLID